jgi:nucleoid-associated protein EbfC
MKDLGGMMRQMQQLQGKVAEAQKRMEAMTVEGQSGGGLVKIVLNGKGGMDALSIDRSLLAEDDVEIVEDLVKAAHEDARKKMEAARAASEKELMGGLPLPPGFKLPF